LFAYGSAVRLDPELAVRQRLYAEYAKTPIVAMALITDPAGRVLIVKPTYKKGWLLLGGGGDFRRCPALNLPSGRLPRRSGST
jgi:hypothetical protein